MKHSKRFIDIVGQKFEKLQVVSFSKNIGKHYFYNVKCDCGNTKLVRKSDLLYKKTTSCGCKQKTSNIIPGSKYNKLTIIEQVKTEKAGIFLKCSCDCGNIKIIKQSNILSGQTTSCGCNKKGCAIKDLTGKTFGNIEVLSFSHVKQGAYWNCKCTCGKIKKISSLSLKKSNSKPRICDCWKKDNKVLGTIYGIYDIDNNLVYIGKTRFKDLEKRLNFHLKSSNNNNMKKWFNEINYKPIIKPIITNVVNSLLEETEKNLINLYKKTNKLLNIHHNK